MDCTSPITDVAGEVWLVQKGQKEVHVPSFWRSLLSLMSATAVMAILEVDALGLPDAAPAVTPASVLPPRFHASSPSLHLTLPHLTSPLYTLHLVISITEGVAHSCFLITFTLV